MRACLTVRGVAVHDSGIICPSCPTLAAAVAIAVGLLCSASVPCQADWSTYRADIARGGVTDESLSHTLALRWIYRPHHAPKPAWPLPSEELPRMHSDNAYHAVISNGLVYFGTSVTNDVLAVDATTGDLRWSFSCEGPVRFAPTVAAGRLYFGSDDGHVYCLDAADGTLQWKRRAGPSDEKVLGNGRMISLWPVRTSVLVDDGLVYFAAGVFPYEGLYVYALHADNGSVVWVNDTVGDRAHELEYGGISPDGYLVASAQNLYIPSGRAMPAAFDRASGKFRFLISPGGKRGGTWTLLDQDRLITGVDASGTATKAAYDAASGKRQEDAFAWFGGTDMAITPDIVYLVNQDGVYAVNRRSYNRAVQESKRLDAARQKLGQTIAALKKQLATNGQQAESEGAKQKLAQQTKELQQLTVRRAQLKDSVYLWHYAGQHFTSIIRAGDLVLAGGRNLVVGLDAKSGKEIWRHDVDGLAVGLAAAEGRLVVSTTTGAVHCFAAGEKDAQQVISGCRAGCSLPGR